MQLFIKWFYGFDPATHPYITFSQVGSRTALLRAARPGDRMVFVGTKNDKTAVENRGKILGMAEIGRVEVDTLDVILDHTKIKKDHWDINGRFKWPKALPIIKAWKFLEPPLLTDLLKRQLPMAAISNAVLLDEKDKLLILTLDCIEVDIPKTETLKKIQEQQSDIQLVKDMPREWQLEVSRITNNILNISKVSDGRMVTSQSKVKNCHISEPDLQIFIAKRLKDQNYRCAITNKPLRVKT